MQQILVQVEDKKKAESLRELLASLDFVISVKLLETQPGFAHQQPPEANDFFALAGLWTNRAIDQSILRQQAWPRQPQ